jgi:hypothetical protein
MSHEPGQELRKRENRPEDREKNIDVQASHLFTASAGLSEA